MDLNAFEAPEIFELVLDSEGRMVRRTDNWPESLDRKEFDALAQSNRNERVAFPPDDYADDDTESDSLKLAPNYLPPRTIRADGRLWRVNAGWNENGCMVLGVDLTSFQRDNRLMAKAFTFSIPVALAFIALGAAFLAHRALRPMNELILLAERMTASGLDERIAETVRDVEFERLIRVFNQMMDRLERSFMQANRFSADAAHELRTPLTILQGHVEQMLHETQLGSEGQKKFEKLLEEIHRIKSILEKLLLLARMDAGRIHLHLEPVDLSAMVENIVEDMQSLAQEITVEIRIQGGIRANADAALLETAIQNVGGNAIKYNRKEQGWIAVELTEDQDAVRLAISNTGPAIAGGERERIFERFYRTDLSRSRTVDGLGLGLSLAREIIHAHQGRLELTASEDGINRFEITLPVSRNAHEFKS